MADGDTELEQRLDCARDTLESVDNWAELRSMLNVIAKARSEWAGLPMPIENETIVVEDRYPLKAEIEKINEHCAPKPANADDEIPADLIRGRFFSTRYKRHVYTCWNPETEKVYKVMLPGQNSFDMSLRTCAISVVWGVEQEARAINLLAGMLPHHLFKSYLLTGMFPETSARSGVTYIFRRLRPTIALRNDQAKNEIRYLAALCMHPIGYYQDSWAGAMCPTDEIIAHLLLMRGDEPMYWRRANQHGKNRPEAGL